MPPALAARLDNRGPALPALGRAAARPALERIADVPIYAADALVRRAESLQLTADARAPVASLPQRAVRRARPEARATRCA